MTRIMFICHGNICRSPMAEFVFKKIVKENGKQDEFCISSSATSTEELGNPVYPPAKKELLKHGISCDGKFSVRLKKSDYDEYDLLICMDSNNIRNTMRILGSDPENKVKKLMDYVGSSRDVSDPWFTGDFEVCYNDVLSGCNALFESLK